MSRTLSSTVSVFLLLLASSAALPAATSSVAPGVPVAASRTDAKVMAAGRALCDQFEQGDVTALLARMTPALRDALGGAAGVAEFRERVLREDGPESGVIVEETRVSGARRIYRRIARRNVGETPTLMEWTLDADDHVVDLVVRPQPVAIPSAKGNY